MTQAQINNQALDACAPELRDDCLQSMGYVRPEETALKGAAASPMEGSIIAAIAVILGILWLASKVGVGLFGTKRAVRYITK